MPVAPTLLGEELDHPARAAPDIGDVAPGFDASHARIWRSCGASSAWRRAMWPEIAAQSTASGSDIHAEAPRVVRNGIVETSTMFAAACPQ